MVLNTDIATEFTQKHNLPAPVYFTTTTPRQGIDYYYYYIVPLAQDTGDVYYCLRFKRLSSKRLWTTAKDMTFENCFADNKYHRGYSEWAVTVERLKFPDICTVPNPDITYLKYGYNRVYITSIARCLGTKNTLEDCLKCIDAYRRRKANDMKLQKKFEIKSATVPDFTEDFRKVVDKYPWKAKVEYFKSTDYKDAQPYRYRISFGPETFKRTTIMVGINKTVNEFELSLTFPGVSQLFGNIGNTFLLKGDSFGTMDTIEKCCEGLDAVMKYLADLLVAGDALWQRINSVRSSQE